jgi:hypothetical protein
MIDNKIVYLFNQKFETIDPVEFMLKQPKRKNSLLCPQKVELEINDLIQKRWLINLS